MVKIKTSQFLVLQRNFISVTNGPINYTCKTYNSFRYCHLTVLKRIRCKISFFYVTNILVSSNIMNVSQQVMKTIIISIHTLKKKQKKAVVRFYKELCSPCKLHLVVYCHNVEMLVVNSSCFKNKKLFSYA